MPYSAESESERRHVTVLVSAWDSSSYLNHLAALAGQEDAMDMSYSGGVGGGLGSRPGSAGGLETYSRGSGGGGGRLSQRTSPLKPSKDASLLMTRSAGSHPSGSDYGHGGGGGLGPGLGPGGMVTLETLVDDMVLKQMAMEKVIRAGEVNESR